MSEKKNIHMPADKVAEFCKRNGIRKLSLFGSALSDDVRPESDIDLLVEFHVSAVPTLIDLACMERELSVILGGRKVDLRTPGELSRYLRDEIMSTARVQYAEVS